MSIEKKYLQYKNINSLSGEFHSALFFLSILRRNCRYYRLQSGQSYSRLPCAKANLVILLIGLDFKQNMTLRWLESNAWLVSRENLQPRNVLNTLYTRPFIICPTMTWSYRHIYINEAQLRVCMRTEGVTSMELLLLRATELCWLQCYFTKWSQRHFLFIKK